MGIQKYLTAEEKKEAQRERCRRWYASHKEQEKERKRKSRIKKLEENPNFDKEWYNKYKDYYTKYNDVNSDKRKDYRTRYNQEHKEEISKNKKRYNSTEFGRAVNLCTTYTQSDNNANREKCTLTPQWIVDNIFSSKCIYCGEDDWTKLGCDRIDNSKPHTPDNVVCSCWECNNKRGTKTYEEFKKEIQNNSIYVSIQ